MNRLASADLIHRVLSAAVGAISFLLLVATSSDYAMVWDEGHTIRREERLAEWFRLLLSPSDDGLGFDAFSQPILEKYWPFGREEPDGHPPVYALVGLLGWRLAPGWIEPLTAYRMGPMALFGATVGMLACHLARTYGWTVSFVAVFFLALHPRVFSHAHYAHYDVPMTCFWLLATMAFSRLVAVQAAPADLQPRPSASRAIWFGVCGGLSIGCKFTGVFSLAAPLVAIMSFPASLADRTAAFIRWSIGSAVAILILIAVQPAWWTNPIDSMIRFLSSNLTRDVTKPIAVLYWGNVYRFSLPWHNTLVLTAITMPVTLLILGAIGVGSGLRRRTPFDTRLWLCSWLVLMIVRALPGAPGHDGERLFLPSYASFFVLAGIGVHTLLATRLRWARAAGRILVAGAMIETGAGLIQLYPYTLSYYNCVVGSLRGAEKHGFELTYYYDTLGSEFFDYVRSGKAGAELRFPSDLVNTEYWRRWGFLPSNVRIVGLEPTSKPSYVLQRRRGLYYPYDDWLDRHGTPSFVLRRQGVELLKVFPFEESLRAYEATRLEAIPEHLRP